MENNECRWCDEPATNETEWGHMCDACAWDAFHLEHGECMDDDHDPEDYGLEPGMYLGEGGWL